jgi:hypothetical protein
MSKSPSTIFAAAFSATARAAASVPIRFDFLRPLWAINTHHTPDPFFFSLTDTPILKALHRPFHHFRSTALRFMG